jgi:hypothetical protein
MTIELSQTSDHAVDYAPRKKIAPRLFWGTAWVVSMLIFAIIQLLLGTDGKIIGLAFFSLLCCAIPLFLFGIDDICAVFIFGLLSKYSFFPLWIKTVMGERIDIGLTAALRTFEMALVGSVICCVALFAAKSIPIRRRLLDFHLSDKQMILAGYLAASFGLIFLVLHVLFVPVVLPSGEVTKGFGGFGSLVGPLYFGIGCLTAISLKRHANPIHRVFLLAIFVALVALSFQTNAKAEFTLAIITFVLTIFYFRIKIKARYIIYCCVFIVFYFFVFAPIIHLTRTDVFKTADFSGKIAIIENMFGSNLMSEFSGQSREIFNYNYYPSIHTFVVDRLEMIQDMDIPAGGIWRGNTIGWLPVQRAIESALPSFIVQEKSNISDIDLIAFNAGYYPILVTLNHTIGVFGTAYAMFLWPGLIFISFTVIFLYLFLLRLIVLPKLAYNPFGIFLLGRYLFVFSEQSVQALLIAILRFIPIDAILILGILIAVVHIFPNHRTSI